MDPNISSLLHILLAVVLGGIIGYERERSGHYAGIRTHIIVCVTSTFLISSFIPYFEYDSIARVCAAIMTGIGFIGAGTIFSHGNKIRGLTTAASVWAVAALGIVIGIGAVWQALVATLIILGILEMKFFVIKHRSI